MPVFEITPADAARNGLAPVWIRGHSAFMCATLLRSEHQYLCCSEPPGGGGGLTIWDCSNAGGNLLDIMRNRLSARLPNSRVESAFVMGCQRTGVMSVSGGDRRRGTFGFVLEAGPAKLLIVVSSGCAARQRISAQNLITRESLASTLASLRIEPADGAVVVRTKEPDAWADRQRLHVAALVSDSDLEVRDPLLENAIEADDDPNGYLVLADMLQAHGCPRGELIARQVRAESDPTIDVQSYFDEHIDEILGSLAPQRLLPDCNRPSRLSDTFSFRRGFIERLRLVSDRGQPMERWIERTFEHPVGRFIRSAELALSSFHEELDSVLSALLNHSRCLETLMLVPASEGYDSYFDGTINPVWQLSSLRHLRVGFDVDLGSVSHDQLESLVLNPENFSTSYVEALAKARLPNLRKLTITFPRYDKLKATIASFAQLATRGDFPALRELALTNIDEPDIQPIKELLMASAFGGTLESLQLSCPR
ncbi:MAG: hypothetical protein QM831_35485 [Kofleriaceae bacterium]